MLIFKEMFYLIKKCTTYNSEVVQYNYLILCLLNHLLYLLYLKLKLYKIYIPLLCVCFVPSPFYFYGFSKKGGSGKVGSARLLKIITYKAL